LNRARYLIDASGNTHQPVAVGKPLRIVSLVPSITELLFDLGLGPSLAGRTTFCVHPRNQVETVPRVGGTKTVRLDRLFALEPTHVIVNIDENPKDVAERIAGTGITVIVTHPNDPIDNLSLYRLLGEIFNKRVQAEVLCKSFSASLGRLMAARTDTRAQRVLYLIWRDPWMTVARDTYIARTLATVGWQQIELPGDERYPSLELEALKGNAVDRVLLSSEPFPFKSRHLEEVTDLLGWRTTSEPKVHLIDGEMLSWYGSRAIEGLSYLARFAVRVAPSNTQ